MSAVMNQSAATADARKIAEALGVTKRAVQRRAIQEDWSYANKNARGGKRRTYEVAKLPFRVQAALLAREYAYWEARRDEVEALLTAIKPCIRVLRRLQQHQEAAWPR